MPDGYPPLILFYSARDSLFSAVHPLLKLIGGYSGCYVSLLVASPDHGDGDPYFSACVRLFPLSLVMLVNPPSPICSVHHFPQDKAVRVNWTEFDKPGFKDGVVGPFFKYIQWLGAFYSLWFN